MIVKDEDGSTYPYKYHDFRWDDGCPLMIFEYKGMKKMADGSTKRNMSMIAKFQNCRAILEIAEVEDENEG